MNEHETDEPTFPMRVAARLTGVAPERLRAWESRHGAIAPRRTAGGSRRYSTSDLDRIRALRRAVEAGHRLSELASLPTGELFQLLIGSGPAAVDTEGASLFAEARAAIEALDGGALEVLLRARLRAVGPNRFAREHAIEFVKEIGESWAEGQLSISEEHLATGVLRALLTEILNSFRPDGRGPRILFASPSGERHDVALLVAGIVAAAKGADVVWVGADIPDEDLVETANNVGIEAVALGFVVLEPMEVEARLRSLRRLLGGRVSLWIGGRGIDGVPPIRGVDRVPTFEWLEAFVEGARDAADQQTEMRA